MPACCWTSTAERQRAHPRAGARAVRNVDHVDAVDPQLRAPARSSASASEPARRQQLDATTNAPRASALRHAATSRRAAPAAPIGGAVDRVARPRARCAAARAGAPSAAHRRLDLPDVLRRRAAAAADQPHAVLMKRRAYDAMYSGEHR